MPRLWRFSIVQPLLSLIQMVVAPFSSPSSVLLLPVLEVAVPIIPLRMPPPQQPLFLVLVHAIGWLLPLPTGILLPTGR